MKTSIFHGFEGPWVLVLGKQRRVEGGPQSKVVNPCRESCAGRACPALVGLWHATPRVSISGIATAAFSSLLEWG